MDLPFSMFVVSDLHLEFCRKPIDKYVNHMPKKDVLILAGDIGLPNKGHFRRFFELVSKKYETIIFVCGNHEYYSGLTDETINKLCAKYGIIMLQNEVFNYQNVIFIGSTLWTELKDPHDNEDISDDNLIYMNDFHRIPWMNKKIWKKMHETSKIFIEKTLKEMPDDKIAIVSPSSKNNL